uniref:CSON003638 protein n=1 Tax=Culicoides sonorensis TaxID=179676 RepID=A0A336MZV2_CULSO
MSLIITNSFNTNYKDASSIFDFSTYDANGNLVNLKEKYGGKVCLILNATTKGSDVKGMLKNLRNIKNSFSEKGKSAHYCIPWKLYIKIHFRFADFAILLFPCFQFGSSDTVKGFLTYLKENSFENEFDVFNETQVNGPNASELFKFLKLKQPGFAGGIINKNFTMFLVNKKGEPVQRWMSSIHPNVIIDHIQQLI